MTDHEITALFLQRSENAIRESQVKYGSLIRRIIGYILQNSQDMTCFPSRSGFADGNTSFQKIQAPFHEETGFGSYHAITVFRIARLSSGSVVPLPFISAFFTPVLSSVPPPRMHLFTAITSRMVFSPSRLASPGFSMSL